MLVEFQILRQQPPATATAQTYRLDIDPSTTILECLNQIKWSQDGTLAFRKNCRNTICGSCSMRINGRAALACKENVGQELAQFGQGTEAVPTITIAPMGNMPVIKDLVVDMQGFWQNLQAVDPYVSTAARQITEREFLQSPADREKLNQMGNCILCGACYSDCNARETNPNFVGPHALAKAYRMVADSRDQATPARLEKYGEGTSGAWGCTRCFNCNAVCPMEVAPLDQISRIKQEILQTQSPSPQSLTPPNPTSQRAMRHRQAMVTLVQQGGWIDERKFGLQVVTNSGRDLAGLFSLLPLGLRMLRRGKFPLAFHPTAGLSEVRSLITAVNNLNSRAINMAKDPMTDVKTPAQPTAAPTQSSDQEPGLGWTTYAERMNGRFAMIGFVLLLLLELLTGQDFFTWLGLR
jgi:succinate dehydrogenase / fumarate reductase iron-sulfur subunit